MSPHCPSRTTPTSAWLRSAWLLSMSAWCCPWANRMATSAPDQMRHHHDLAGLRIERRYPFALVVMALDPKSAVAFLDQLVEAVPRDADLDRLVRVPCDRAVARAVHDLHRIERAVHSTLLWLLTSAKVISSREFLVDPFVPSFAVIVGDVIATGNLFW